MGHEYQLGALQLTTKTKPHINANPSFSSRQLEPDRSEAARCHNIVVGKCDRGIFALGLFLNGPVWLNADSSLSKINKNRSKHWTLKLPTTSMIDVRILLIQECPSTTELLPQQNSKLISSSSSSGMELHKHKIIST